MYAGDITEIEKLTDTIMDHGQLPGSLELAYLGDALYDLRVREALTRKGGRVKNMHREAVKHVCAHAQAEALSRVEGMLDEEEQNVVRRARNAHQTPSKNADGTGGTDRIFVYYRPPGANARDS